MTTVTAWAVRGRSCCRWLVSRSAGAHRPLRLGEGANSAPARCRDITPASSAPPSSVCCTFPLGQNALLPRRLPSFLGQPPFLAIISTASFFPSHIYFCSLFVLFSFPRHHPPSPPPPPPLLFTRASSRFPPTPPTFAAMSFMGGAECSTAGNPLSQFTKHVQDDRSLQRDRLVNGGPSGALNGFRSAGRGVAQDEVSRFSGLLVSYIKARLTCIFSFSLPPPPLRWSMASSSRAPTWPR